MVTEAPTIVRPVPPSPPPPAPPEEPSHIRRWVAALRDPKYIQIRYRSRGTRENEFCAIGLADYLGLSGGRMAKELNGRGVYVGVIKMNDLYEYSFSQIADYLEDLLRKEVNQ